MNLFLNAMVVGLRVEKTQLETQLSLEGTPHRQGISQVFQHFFSSELGITLIKT